MNLINIFKFIPHNKSSYYDNNHNYDCNNNNNNNKHDFVVN